VLAVPAASGFSAVSADRSVEVAVADDDEAYLGVAQELSNTNMSTGTTDIDVTVTNRFGSKITLDTVEVTVNGDTKELESLGPGEDGTAKFTGVDCSREIDVAASGSGVDVELDREIGC